MIGQLWQFISTLTSIIWLRAGETLEHRTFWRFFFSGSGRSRSWLRYLKGWLQTLPFSLPAVFHSFAISLLACFLSLAGPDQDPDTSYKEGKSGIPKDLLGILRQGNGGRKRIELADHNLRTGSLFGERMKKLRGEEERERACRQTFQAAIPSFCVIADRNLSARSLSVTWMHWNVINFACKKGVGCQHTTLNSCQIAACSDQFFLW